MFMRDPHPQLIDELRARTAVVSAGLTLLIQLAINEGVDPRAYERRLIQVEDDVTELLEQLRHTALPG
jgi:hypothetical protein